MWWYAYGWWWWWIVFVILFFLLPLGYGWGYRGWGPWYRRRRRSDLNVPSPEGRHPERRNQDDFGAGWGWVGGFLWFILLVALIWLLIAGSWGYWW